MGRPYRHPPNQSTRPGKKVSNQMTGTIHQGIVTARRGCFASETTLRATYSEVMWMNFGAFSFFLTSELPVCWLNSVVAPPGWGD